MNEPRTENANLLQLREGIPQKTPSQSILFPEMSVLRMEQTPSQDQTRRCSKCKLPFPLAEFEKKGGGYRHSHCKPCRYAYTVAWLKKRRESIHSKRPQPSKCPVCGNETQFFWRLSKWNCLQCSKIKAKKLRMLLKARADKRRTIRNWTAKYGPEIVTVALSKQKIDPKLKPDFFALRNQLLPPSYLKLKREALERLHKLNEMLGLPSGNVGWTCQKCHCYSADPRFFDIDHIIPRSKKGHGKRSNLQVICPNCHRRKTIIDLHQVIIEGELS